MKISLEWLKQYVDYQGSVEQLDELFTNAGFPVEEIQQVGDDWMLDVEITSNRPDCLGHIGLAREVAAITGATLKLPDVTFKETGTPVNELTSVDNQTPETCARYTARIVDHVKVGPSPDWMRRRLETIGQRSINNVVDITNYVLMEIGQPLHSFDYDKLDEGRIIVRMAKQGEQMDMIDHSKIELKSDMMVIADANKPVALAGVMGGLTSEVSPETRTVLLESAYFAPLSIRRTSRALTLGSESSFRFERDVDVEMLEWASRRAAALLEELADGKVAPEFIDSYPGKIDRPNITMRMSRLNALVGIDFDPNQVVKIFQGLGFEPKFDGQDVIECIRPTWRADLSREVDLIEEVIRVYGYDHIPTETKIHIDVKTKDAIQRTRQTIRSVMAGCGFYETIGVSFVEDQYGPLFAPEGFKAVRVRDYTRKSNNCLRHSLLPSLMAARKRNQDAGNGRCDLYELAAVHMPAENGKAKEFNRLTFITDGDFRELRGVIEAVIARLDKTVKVDCKPTDCLWSDQGEAAQLIVNGKIIGLAGRASKKIIDAFGLNQDICMAEIDFDQLLAMEGSLAELEPLARFPGIVRDLSLVLEEAVTWAEIEETILSLNLDDMCDLNYVDIYRGKGIDKGKKSLTLSMTFRRAEETLRHEQVDGQIEKTVAVMKEKFAAELRS